MHALLIIAIGANVPGCLTTLAAYTHVNKTLGNVCGGGCGSGGCDDSGSCGGGGDSGGS